MYFHFWIIMDLFFNLRMLRNFQAFVLPKQMSKTFGKAMGQKLYLSYA